MLFRGKLILDVEVEARNSVIALQKLRQDCASSMYGLKKEIVLEPDFREEDSSQEVEESNF